LRTNREDAAPVAVGRGEVNGPSMFQLFGDGDDAALFTANDDRGPRYTATYPGHEAFEACRFQHPLCHEGWQV
jgi:hypothetical protein